MKIMERVIVKVRSGMWDALERLELEFEALEGQWGFPANVRYRPGASGMVMDLLVIEREWESYAAREAAYEKALVNHEWHLLGKRSHAVVESVQAEFYHPVYWRPEDLKPLPDKETLDKVRERLTSGKLTTDDISIIAGIIEEKSSGVTTIAGRPVVAHLPNGMDVIK